MDWHSEAKKEINANSVGRWSKELEDWEAALFSKKLKNELQFHHYDISDLKIRIPLNIYIKYIYIKIIYISNQYGANIIDRIMSFFYLWDLDYRK
jgi:hypothetical protein